MRGGNRLIRFLAIVLIQALLVMDAGGVGTAFSASRSTTMLAPTNNINAESFKHTFLSGFEAINPIPEIKHNSNVKTVGDRSGSRSVTGGAQMFWLRDLLWVAVLKLAPNVFVNRQQFNVRYGLTIAPWLENFLVYGVSWMLGVNPVIVWGLFAVGYVVDSILNLVRSPENRAPPENLLYAGIIALINVYICLIPRGVLNMFLTWFSHQTINYIAKFSLIRNRRIRAVALMMVFVPIFAHVGYILGPRVYFPTFNESVLLNYLGIPKEQQNSDGLGAIKTITNANTDMPYGENWSLHRWQTGYSIFKIEDLEHVWRLKANFRSCKIIEDVFKKHGINVNDYSLSRYSTPTVSAETVARDFKDLKLILLGALNELLDMPDLYAHVPTEIYSLDMENKAMLEELKSRLQRGEMVDERLKHQVNKAILTDIFRLALTDWGSWNRPVELNPDKKNEMLLQSLEYLKKIADGRLKLDDLSNESSALYFMDEIRRIPREVINYCIESANAHNLPPSLLIAGAVAYPNYVFNNPYQLDKGIDILWRRNAISKTVRDTLIDALTNTGTDKIIIDNQTRDFVGGVVFNSKATMGLMGIRPGWVREYDGWKRFGIDTNRMNDKEIAWELLDIRLNIEACAAMWERASLEVVDIIRNARRGISPVLSERHIREAGTDEITMGKHPPLTAEFYSSLPLEELQRGDYWLLAQFHPMRYQKLRSFIDIQGFVLTSGVLNGRQVSGPKYELTPIPLATSPAVRNEEFTSRTAEFVELSI